MFFEGAEKKAQIYVDTEQISLLNDIDEQFWQALVHCCNAQILSCITNQECKAFLLSESSLFVWHDRLLILTCGETQLVNSIEYFIEHIGKNKIKQLTYQRKNEYFAHAQPSCFGDDIKKLSKHLKGNIYRFGELDGHHNYLFTYDHNFIAIAENKSYEYIAYQISNTASKLLTTSGISAQEIRQFLGLESLLPGFLIDDFVFSPYGYSLNAIKNGRYLTIHITPQSNSSYISFESNIDLMTVAPLLNEIIKPLTFDLLSYNEFDFINKTQQISNTQQYVSKTLVQKKLPNGYQVNFANFILPQTNFIEPSELIIDGKSFDDSKTL